MSKLLAPILLSLVLLDLLIEPSCQRFHFQTGIIEITGPSGNRTMHSEFHNGQIGKIGKGIIFRAQLQDGSTLMIENREATEPEEHK